LSKFDNEGSEEAFFNIKVKVFVECIPKEIESKITNVAINNTKSLLLSLNLSEKPIIPIAIDDVKNIFLSADM
tara:strand:+ start:757 stop:975 length:219 start_codon:yes stop_codon:yes gene_type:complete